MILLSELLRWLFKSDPLLHTCKWLWSWTNLTPRARCTNETAGGAVEFPNVIVWVLCLTRLSGHIPFVFCSLSRRALRPSERVFAGRSAARPPPTRETQQPGVKTVRRETLCVRSNYSVVIIAAFITFSWSYVPDFSKPALLFHSHLEALVWPWRASVMLLFKNTATVFNE